MRAQSHFIRTDILGLFYDNIKKLPGSVYGKKYSLGLEQKINQAPVTVGIHGNLGYTPAGTLKGDLLGTRLEVRHGTFLFIDVKWFVLGSRNNPPFQNATGLFAGAYGSLMKLNDETWVENRSKVQWDLVRSKSIQVSGLGAIAGYRQVFVRHLFADLLVAAGIGFPGSHSTDTWRAEVGIGYCY